MIIAELRRPEGPPSGAPYSYGKQKETHELIFRWLSRLAVLLMGAYVRRRRRRRRRRSRATWRLYTSNGLTVTCSFGLLCTSLILDIHVIINWHLSKQGIGRPVSRDHTAGSSLELIEVKCFFEVDRWPRAGFSIESQVHVWFENLAGLFGSRLTLTQD